MRSRNGPNDYLFASSDLSDYLHSCEHGIKSHVDDIPKDTFLANSDGQIVDHIVSKVRIEPLTIHTDAIRMEPLSESKIDISSDQNRYITDRSRSLHIDSVSTNIEIPFSGLPLLLRMVPSQRYMGNAPRARVHNQTILIDINIPSDRGADQISQIIKSHCESTLKMITDYAGWSTNDVNNYNNSLPAKVCRIVEQRRKYLNQQGNILEMIDIPVKSNSAAPPIVPINLRPRIEVSLAPPPRGGIKPEPGISKDLFNKIVGILQHKLRNFETTPETFSKLAEEEIRDIILADLNGYFLGAATGEAFRKRGKTDIRIEDSDRSAFIAECKFWRGEKSIVEALNQLLDYLVWRDCKSSLIIFNKDRKGFSSIIGNAFKTLREHADFVREDKSASHDAERRYIFRSHEDAGREIAVHVFLINIFWDKRPVGTRR